MTEKQAIESLISKGRFEEALNLLTANIKEQDCADARYMRGQLLWKLGRHAQAISDYEHALAFDPGSPAATALEIARQVMDFYNPDLLNP